MSLTHEEKSLVSDLAYVWNAYLELPEENHPGDKVEFCHHLHILQRMILSRSGRREMNEAP